MTELAGACPQYTAKLAQLDEVLEPRETDEEDLYSLTEGDLEKQVVAKHVGHLGPLRPDLTMRNHGSDSSQGLLRGVAMTRQY